MKSDRSSTGAHLDDDAIQTLLDAADGRDDGATASARGHLANCAACRARVEAWREVFGELGRLRRFAPPGRLAERVMSEVDLPARSTSRSRAWSWLGLRRLLRGRAARTHLSARRLQELADGALSRRRAALARAHVAACARCEDGLAGWRRLIAALEALPSLAPGAGFAERVMARWRETAEQATVRSPDARTRRLWPHSPRGWALAGALGSAPVAALVAAGVFVSTVPQLTVGGLATYLWWQTRDALAAFGSSLLTTAMQSGAAFRAYAFADSLVVSPTSAAAGAAAFATLMLASLWVLHRHLGFRVSRFAMFTVDRHVHS